jgi:hypothetical protein
VLDAAVAWICAMEKKVRLQHGASEDNPEFQSAIANAIECDFFG